MEDRAACGSDALAERRDRRRVGGPQASSDKECSAEGKPEGDADARDNARGDNDEDRGGQDDAAQCPLHAHERDRQGFPVQEEGRKIVRTIVGENEASETPGMNEAPAPAAMRSTGPIRLNLLVRRMQHTAAIPRTMIASTVMVPLSGGILL